MAMGGGMHHVGQEGHLGVIGQHAGIDVHGAQAASFTKEGAEAEEVKL